MLALNPPPYAQVWRQHDANTLICRVPGDLAFLPLPPSTDGGALAGLITLYLPEGIKDGQVFRCVGQQFTRAKRIAGAFQISVTAIADHDKLRVDDMDQLAILKNNLSLTSSDDRWGPVLERMILQLSDRLRGFNVDPGSVAPSPWGLARMSPSSSAQDERPRLCLRKLPARAPHRAAGFREILGICEGAKEDKSGGRRSYGTWPTGASRACSSSSPTPAAA